MPRILVTVPLVWILLSQVSTAQEDDLLFWDRINVSLHWSHHFARWSDLNRSLDFVGNAVATDPYFQNPSGLYETIHGDGAGRVRISCSLVGQFALVLQGGYTRTHSSSTLTFYEGSSSRPTTFSRDILFEGWSGGIGVAFQQRLAPKLTLRATAAVDRTTATLHIDDTKVPIVTVTPRQVIGGHVRANAWGITLGGSVHYAVSGPLGIEAGVEYRFLKLPSMVGVYTERIEGYYPEERTYTGFLGQSPTYFGITTDTPGSIYLEGLRPVPYFMSPDSYDPLTPAGLDLSGWGVSAGIVFEL